jgi:hypothetical protein
LEVRELHKLAERVRFPTLRLYAGLALWRGPLPHKEMQESSILSAGTERL